LFKFILLIKNILLKTKSILPPYVREVVFNYHVQNTYGVDDYFYIIQEYEATNDLLLQRKLLEALSYTRQAWLLAT
jgi:hypothetical protein